jgi:phenylalanyl-tRNA synthetase alpha chain
MIKERIHQHFNRCFHESDGTPIFKYYDEFSPRVTVEACFDSLLIPHDHPSRNLTDTFYFHDNEVLRTHTSAHQAQLMSKGIRSFLVTGDCYRRDEIDSSHYPVFHQMEGVRVFDPHLVHKDDVEFAVRDLKTAVEGMIISLFGPLQFRWNDDYFPFTDPSFELEINHNGKWMEVLGSGVIHRKLLDKCGYHDSIGWAFGFGLERLAMILFDIPDIRLFWSRDPRFLDQWKEGTFSKFFSFSKYPPCTKDVSFWLGKTEGEKPIGHHEHDVSQIIREVAGDLVEDCKIVSDFVHPTSGRQSKCYRIVYRSFDRTLTNEEVDALQESVRAQLASQLDIELR